MVLKTRTHQQGRKKGRKEENGDDDHLGQEPQFTRTGAMDFEQLSEGEEDDGDGENPYASFEGQRTQPPRKEPAFHGSTDDEDDYADYEEQKYAARALQLID